MICQFHQWNFKNTRTWPELNLSDKYSLPNQMFWYIMARMANELTKYIGFPQILSVKLVRPVVFKNSKSGYNTNFVMDCCEIKWLKWIRITSDVSHKSYKQWQECWGDTACELSVFTLLFDPLTIHTIYSNSVMWW